MRYGLFDFRMYTYRLSIFGYYNNESHVSGSIYIYIDVLSIIFIQIFDTVLKLQNGRSNIIRATSLLRINFSRNRETNYLFPPLTEEVLCQAKFSKMLFAFAKPRDSYCFFF